MAQTPRVVAELGRPETPDETAARKAESSRVYRASQNTRNLVAALLVTLAVVAVIIFAVPRGAPPAARARSTSPRSRETIEAAEGRTVIVPDVPEDWLRQPRRDRGRLDRARGRSSTCPTRRRLPPRRAGLRRRPGVADARAQRRARRRHRHDRRRRVGPLRHRRPVARRQRLGCPAARRPAPTPSWSTARPTTRRSRLAAASVADQILELREEATSDRGPRPRPRKAWQEMQRGNARFVAGEPRHPRQDVERRAELAARPDARAPRCSAARTRASPPRSSSTRASATSSSCATPARSSRTR